MRTLILCAAIALLSLAGEISSADQPLAWSNTSASSLDLALPAEAPAPLQETESIVSDSELPSSAGPALQAESLHQANGCGGCATSCCDNAWDGYCNERRQWRCCRPSACSPPCRFPLQFPRFCMPEICMPEICMPEICLPKIRMPEICVPRFRMPQLCLPTFHPYCPGNRCRPVHCGQGCLPCFDGIRNSCSSLWTSCHASWSNCGQADPCGCTFSEPCQPWIPGLRLRQFGWGLQESCSSLWSGCTSGCNSGCNSGCSEIYDYHSYPYEGEVIESAPVEAAPTEAAPQEQPEPSVAPASNRSAQEFRHSPLFNIFQ